MGVLHVIKPLKGGYLNSTYRNKMFEIHCWVKNRMFEIHCWVYKTPEFLPATFSLKWITKWEKTVVGSEYFVGGGGKLFKNASSYQILNFLTGILGYHLPFRS